MRRAGERRLREDLRRLEEARACRRRREWDPEERRGLERERDLERLEICEESNFWEGSLITEEAREAFSKTEKERLILDREREDCC